MILVTMENHFYAQGAEAVLKEFDSQRTGLESEEAARRLQKFGPNELPRPKKPNLILLFLKQFRHILTYVLFGAAAISFFLNNKFDAYAIILVVLINAVVGFVQERRAERALEALRQFTVPMATILRANRMHKIAANSIVPGDILVIETGDRIAADARLIEIKDLTTSEAVLTGESLPVTKTTAALTGKLPTADQTNMVWMGTTAASGIAQAVVISTGINTAFGRIARNLEAIKRKKTPFERSVNRLGGALGTIAIFISAIIAFIGILRGFGLLELFVFSVAAAVSSIPEGLPVVLALVLAIGVERMARRRAVIRHLPAVETLGVADVICVDKTGTLTENKMVARAVALQDSVIDVTGSAWSPQGKFTRGENEIRPLEYPDLNRLLKIAAVCNHAELTQRDGEFDILGDPTEGALVVLKNLPCKKKNRF